MREGGDTQWMTIASTGSAAEAAGTILEKSVCGGNVWTDRRKAA